MHKFTFTAETEVPYEVKVKIETDAVSLSDVVQEFRSFLLSVGFHHESVDEYLNLE